MQIRKNISGILASGFILAGCSIAITQSSAESRQMQKSTEIDPSRIQLANLEQDIAYLKTALAQIRLEFEQLARQNADLKKTLNSRAVLLESYITRESFTHSINALREEMKSAGETGQKQIIGEVSRQLERLANQTDEAIKALAKSIDAQPEIIDIKTFSDKYSRDGIAYTVQSGDTLSEIAHKFNSTVSDIKNANRIADPKKLKVGRTLFIPQEEKEQK